jgi:hypothetical protein
MTGRTGHHGPLVFEQYTAIAARLLFDKARSGAKIANKFIEAVSVDRNLP